MIESDTMINFICAVICAKWAFELGFSQIRQLLLFIGGFLFGPFAMLILYLYKIRNAQKTGNPGGMWFTSGKCETQPNT